MPSMTERQSEKWTMTSGPANAKVRLEPAAELGGPAPQRRRLAAKSADHDGFRAHLAALCEAIASRKVENICATYQALRNQAKGVHADELIRQVEQAAGEPVLSAIVSAFSHYRCFMCDGGTRACETCHGTGRIDGTSRCTYCEGLGLIGCDFCHGTGWADRSLIPREIRSSVLQRQDQHVRDDVRRLVTTFKGLGPHEISRLDGPQRKELAGWLLRLQGRLGDLLASPLNMSEHERARRSSLAAKIAQCLDLLRQTQ